MLEPSGTSPQVPFLGAGSNILSQTPAAEKSLNDSKPKIEQPPSPKFQPSLPANQNSQEVARVADAPYHTP
jgi:hypothetical protein